MFSLVNRELTVHDYIGKADAVLMGLFEGGEVIYCFFIEYYDVGYVAFP